MTLSQISTALHAASAVIFSLCAANAAIVGSLLGSWQNARATGGAGICSPPIWINAHICKGAIYLVTHPCLRASSVPPVLAAAA